MLLHTDIITVRILYISHAFIGRELVIYYGVLCIRSCTLMSSHDNYTKPLAIKGHAYSRHNKLIDGYCMHALYIIIYAIMSYILWYIISSGLFLLWIV